MRKFALFLAAVLAVSLAGCSLQGGNDQTNTNHITSVSDNLSEPQPQFSREGNFIRTNSKNLYEMNFAELEEQLEEIIGAKDNKISMPFMYELPAVDIFFTPNGEMMNFNMSLRALTGENENEFIISRYKVGNNTETETDKFQTMPQVFSENVSTKTGFDVQLSEKNQPFLKRPFEDTFVFEKFPAFMEWANSFDFEKVIQEYSVGEPVRYEFLAGVTIEREVIENENVNCIFLDCSSGMPVQVKYEDLPYSDTAIYPFEPTHDVNDSSQYLEYYVILPYYPADEVTGFPPRYVYTSPENAENRDAYSSNSNANVIGNEKYNLNNIIILFPNGI